MLLLQKQEGADTMKKFIITVIIIFCIIVGVIGAGNISYKAKESKRREAPNGLLTVPDDSDEKYIESLKGQKSDIKGMTKYDKYKKGLSPENGSDSDGDGLSDREEIEVWGTDPLKASTAGDLTTDGEKVKRGLDPTVPSKDVTADDVTYPYNKCKEVTLEADCAEGRAAIVTKPYFHKLAGIKTYQEYQVESFSGKMTIDVAEILSGNHIEMTNIAVYMQDGTGKAERVKKGFSTKGKNIILKGIFRSNGYYDIFIVKTSPLLPHAADIIDSDADDKSFTGMLNSVNKNDTYNAVIKRDENMDGIAYGAPFLHFVTGEINILYTDTGDKEKNELIKETLVKRANSMDEADMTIKSKKIKKASKAKIERLYKIFSTIFPNCNGAAYNTSLDSGKWGLIFYYERFASADKMLQKTNDNVWQNINATEKDSGFTFGKDQFAFPNISSKLTGGGLCAGIATYTAKVYNSKEVKTPLSGSIVDYDKKEHKWNIKGDNFKKLRNRGIHSFRDADYVKKHTDSDGYMTKDMSDDDKNFLNMITWYWSGANKTTKQNYVLFAGLVHGINCNDYKWDTIEYIKKKIDKGEIVSVGMRLGNDKSSKGVNKTGHMINLVDYLEREDGAIKFKVYDCNVPEDSGEWLYVKKKYESFDFKYQPDENDNDYVMTNEKTFGTYSFRVLDENDFSVKSTVSRNTKGKAYKSTIVAWE